MSSESDDAAQLDAADAGVEVQVLRSAKRADTYLYLPVDDAYEELPEALREHFGEATSFLTFTLHEQRFLAQSDPRQVLAALREQGFYLQLPPQNDPDDG